MKEIHINIGFLLLCILIGTAYAVFVQRQFIIEGMVPHPHHAAAAAAATNAGAKNKHPKKTAEAAAIAAATTPGKSPH